MNEFFNLFRVYSTSPPRPLPERATGQSGKWPLSRQPTDDVARSLAGNILAQDTEQGDYGYDYDLID